MIINGLVVYFLFTLLLDTDAVLPENLQDLRFNAVKHSGEAEIGRMRTV